MLRNTKISSWMAVWLMMVFKSVAAMARFEGVAGHGSGARASSSSNHTVNFAVVVSTSRFYHNYRHVTNALTIYNALRRGGLPDSHIILMLADDIPCNARNPKPNSIVCQRENLFSSTVEVDYRGNDVTVDNFIRVLTGRHLIGTPPNRRLPYEGRQRANVLIYITGHGGDKFMKFQDTEEITSKELAQTFAHMRSLHRYNEILFISDTCQAFTLSDEIDADNVISIGSSLRGENSYGHHVDHHFGVAVIDSFTHAFRSFTKTVPSWQKRSIRDWIDTATYAKLSSHVGFTDRTSQRKIQKIPMADFFTMKTKSQFSPYDHEILPVCIKGSLVSNDTFKINKEESLFSTSQGEKGSTENKGIDDSFHLAAYDKLNMILSLPAASRRNIMSTANADTASVTCSIGEFQKYRYFPSLSMINIIQCDIDASKEFLFSECMWKIFFLFGLGFVVASALLLQVFLVTVTDDECYIR
jgi:phosphatidylinositol glycan class K